ncbi:hypothetical protein OAO77_01230 [Candidatus Pelagibacter sp.]|nr:hypothetical protein [Candidatus Pelagibacter sp.]
MNLKKKIVIFKNDRGGDLFISLKTIASLKNEYENITIFLSELNFGFKFLFNNFKIKKVNYNLSIINKINIIIFLFQKNINEVYILAPKNFYFFLPLIFRKTKFYAITINGDKRNRPPNYLRRFLNNYVEISRNRVKNKISSRDLQLNLLNVNINIDYQYKNLTIPIITEHQKKVIPNNFVYLQFKKNFFEDFGWGTNQFLKIIDLLLTKYENVLFSSDIEESSYNHYFYKNFSRIDLISSIIIKRNTRNVFFLNKIESRELFLIINASDKCVAPHGLVTNICYFLDKKSINLFNYQASNFNYHLAKISFSEWYANMKIDFLFLKEDINKSLNKINKYL